jgi:hypothetical protein
VNHISVTMSLLISREFDELYEMCVDQGWDSRKNTEDTMCLVSPGDFAEVHVKLTCDNEIYMSVPIRCHGDPYATQYSTCYVDATAAAKFGEMHMVAHAAAHAAHAADTDLTIG